MIDEDYKKAGFFAIESHSEDEATRDQVYTRRWIFAPISSISCYFVTFMNRWIIVLPEQCSLTQLSLTLLSTPT